jgi:hypothetical protein
MKKKGAVKGEVMYKVVLEDEQGFLGPASEASKKIGVDGSEVSLTDIYIPHDTRIVRKRLYRSDVDGVFRHLDTIERLQSSYRDNIPDELLGAVITADFFKPPRALIMRKLDNKMGYANVIDRLGRKRPSRLYISEPFAPHQVADASTFDINPEDGQEIRGFAWYYGHILVWKDRSFYSVDPNSYERVPRDAEVGLIAPKSLWPIPGIGYGWLSHLGVMMGDQSSIDKFVGLPIWDDIKGYTPEELSKAIAFYHDHYYYIFLGYDDVGSGNYVYNTKGYACYIPTMQWCAITGWNVQSVSRWTGHSDNNEIYVGTDYGYVNQILTGNTDLSDDGNDTASQIQGVIRTLDDDFGTPTTDMFHRELVVYAKNLVSGVATPDNRATITATPYVDQVAGSAYAAKTIANTTYDKYWLRGRENDNGSLLAQRLVISKRAAIRSITHIIGERGERPR